VANSVGQIFVELDLDASRYTKGQQKLLQDATTTTLNIEQNFKNLGVKSSAEMDLMRAKITNSFDMIANSSKASANDIMRAEEAKNAALKRLNEQQYGAQTSTLDKLKSNWLAVSAAVVAAWYTVSRVVGAVEGVVMAAARYETLGVVMKVVGNNIGYTGAQMEEFAAGLEKSGISMSGARQALTRMSQAHLDLAQSEKLARVAQDAAVIGAMNSTEAFNQMVYGIQSANVRVLRTIGINVNFEDSYNRVAKATGRTTDSFSEAEKAGIRLNAVMEAGKSIAGSYEESMGTAGKQLLSLERHFENLKVLAGAAFTPALAEIVEMITGAVVGMNKELSGESKEAVTKWGINFRITLISIEAELMRLGMFLDKIGGTLTSAQMLLYGPGSALGIESSVKRFESAAKANIEYEERYKATERELVKLAQKQIDLENSLTVAGRAKVKAAQEELENKRIAAGEAQREAEAEAKRLADAAEKAKKFAEDIAKVQEKAYIKEGELLMARDKEEEEYFKNLKKEQEKAAKDAEKFASDKLKAERDIYKDLRKYSGEYFNETKKLIDEQAAKYRKLGIDEAAIFAWVKEETIKAYIEMGQKSDDWADGVMAAYYDLERSAMTYGKAAYEMVKELSKSASSTLSSVFFDAAKGQMKSFKDYWTSFTDALLKKFADIVAQMAVEWATAQLFMKQSWVGNSLMGSLGGSAAMSAGSSMLIPISGAGAGAYVMASGTGLEALAEAGLLSSESTTATGALVYGSPEYAAALGELGIGEAGVAGLGSSSWMASMSAAAPYLLAALAADQLLFGGKGTSAITDAVGSVGGAIWDTGESIVNSVSDFFGFHSGGLVGYDAPTFTRSMPSIAFAGAPRFHGGGFIGNDEVPAILQKGERVLSRKQNADYESGPGRPINITFELDGKVLSNWMYNESKNGQNLIHVRGIVDK